MKTNITIVACIIVALLTAGSATAWLDTYAHRQSITLTGASDGAQTNYQIKLDVPYTAAMQADFDDVRFTHADGDTLIDAWLESKTDSTSAVMWAEFPTTPSDGVEQTYYMYYGNDSVASDWDIATTFEYSDDYESIPNFIGTDGDRSTLLARSPTHSMLLSSGTMQSTSIDAPLGSRSMVFWIYTPTIWGRLNTIAVLDKGGSAATDSGAYIKFDSGMIFYASPGWTSTGTAYTIGWHKCEIVQHSTTFDFVFNGASNNYPNMNTISEIDKLHLGHDGLNHYYDDIFVCKYVVNPATYVFGSEESPGAPVVPSITAYNNITGARAHIPLGYGTAVMFNATADAAVTWAWTLDGVDQGVVADNYTHTFSAGFGYYAVTVTATNSGGTDTFTWGVWENIETTAQTVPTFTNASYQMLIESIDYPPDMEDFGKAMASPFVQLVGVIFYLFIFGIPLLMMYIRQDNMTLPTTLLLLFGSIIIFMLPPQWQIIAGALMTLGFVGILFKLYKERER